MTKRAVDMKQTISALALAAALAGCNASSPNDFSATAADVEARSSRLSGREALNERIAHYARAHHVPASLVHASVQRESKYNPAARNGPYWGLMQIRYDTALSMGYSGSPSGLLDAETNLKYGVPYLANAYIVAGGDERLALKLYASGYYFKAKQRGLLGQMQTARAATENSQMAQSGK